MGPGVRRDDGESSSKPRSPTAISRFRNGAHHLADAPTKGSGFALSLLDSSRSASSESSRTAFVFAGGGSFGAVQVGMMQSLAQHGITADMVVGSSVGALNGAYY